MGTHVSRVKSVDLDSWTDEQIQSVIKWGNARANKFVYLAVKFFLMLDDDLGCPELLCNLLTGNSRYWEAKLPVGHVPSEAKIENFIRTKYESKRWVMDGPMPDPSTLDGEADDDVPLAVVQEKAKLERSASHRAASTAPRSSGPAAQQQSIDLFGDDVPTPPVRPRTTDIPGAHVSAKSSQPAAPPKQSKPGDSLLGLDFFGTSQTSTTSKPSSTPPGPATTGLSRPDLKQSILSLYASAPKSQTAPQHDRTTSFGSSVYLQSQPKAHSDAFGGLTDAFSGLSFPSSTSSSTKKETSSSALGSANIASPKSTPSVPQFIPSSSALSGDGGLLDSVPSKPEKKSSQTKFLSTSPSQVGGSFNLIDATMGSAKSTATPPTTSKNDMLDLFSSPPSTTSLPATSPTKPTDLSSVFNLSSPKPQPVTQPPPASTTTATSMLSAVNIDPWGGNAWTSADPSPPTTTAQSTSMKLPDTLTANDIGSGWGTSSGFGGTSASKPTPTVTADEDFGGWASAVPNDTTTTAPKAKPTGGFAGNDDLFSNVWQ
ncbi:ARF GAP with effector function(s) [Emydomyces testavorans]|uniref:ARF GAP with effector function(S) n=1 Tax=Emydomyces testavorans TaxID=2070801 RepID=A0AAF0IHV4_9EURO|nr:ARF GAP with effector function(s) [Emydomyces testavorans]